MPFQTRSAPLALYRDGKLDEALESAHAIQAMDPNAAEAWLCALLVALRRSDQPAMAEALRRCLALRSGEWVLERLRADFVRAGSPRLPRELAFRLGGQLRGGLSPLAPILASEQRRAQHGYINVVGTSYVRSFGGSDAFFPLFIGMGPTMLLLTEELAAATWRKFQVNLARVDTRRDTILVLGGDPYYHATNLKKTRTSEAPQATPDDYAMMEVAAERHRPLLADARAQVNGRLMFLGATPSFNRLMDQLSLRLNALLGPICAEYDIELLDWWEHLADPETQHLRAEFSANAYPGDVHFSLATTKLFMELLQAKGLLPEGVSPAADFEWTHVFECQVDPAERTRIWSEPSVSPNNAFRSHKIAASHLGVRVADLICALLALKPEQTVAIANVRDGHAAVSLPAQLHSGCLAVTDTPANLHVARTVMDFYGRSDVDLRLFGPETLQALKGAAFDILLLMVHPDTAEADEARSNAILEALGAAATVVIATPFADRLRNLSLGGRRIGNDIAISNRHLPEVWRDYRVFIAR